MPETYFNVHKVQKLLQEHRELCGLSVSDLGRRFYQLVSSGEPLGPEWEHFRAWISPRGWPDNAVACRARLDRFFKNELKEPPTTFDAFLPLADIHGVSQLMLSPFRANYVENPIHGKAAKLFAIDRETSSSSVYSFLNALPSAVDATFVKVQLEAGEVSEEHWHIGDELVVVLSGEAEILFPETGSRYTGMTRGDCVHFNAESLHRISNCSPNGEQLLLIVIRVNQLHGGLRRRARADLMSGGSGEFLELWAKGELMEVGVEHGNLVQNDLFPDSGAVGDPIGLIEMLRFFRDQDGYGSKQLWERRNIKGALRGDISAAKAISLDEVASLMALPSGKALPDVFTRIYESRAKSGCVLVSEKQDDMIKIVKSDGSHTSDYRVPKQHLFGSDISLSYLSFSGDIKTSPLCPHPGIEIVFALSGKSEVHIETVKGATPEISKLNGKNNDLMIFNSSRDHRVVGVGEKKSKVLIIRMYGYN